MHPHPVCRKIWVVLIRGRGEDHPRHAELPPPASGWPTRQNWPSGWHTEEKGHILKTLRLHRLWRLYLWLRKWQMCQMTNWQAETIISHDDVLSLICSLNKQPMFRVLITINTLINPLLRKWKTFIHTLSFTKLSLSQLTQIFSSLGRYLKHSSPCSLTITKWLITKKCHQLKTIIHTTFWEADKSTSATPYCRNLSNYCQSNCKTHSKTKTKKINHTGSNCSSTDILISYLRDLCQKPQLHSYTDPIEISEGWCTNPLTVTADSVNHIYKTIWQATPFMSHLHVTGFYVWVLTHNITEI